MYNKNRILNIILVSLLIICGAFSQITLLAPSIQITDNPSDFLEENYLETPETSDVSGSYDLGDGNTMDIDAVDNTTTTTLNNNIDGEYLTFKSEKNDTSTSTLLNNSKLITTDREKSFHLENIKTQDSELHISNQYQLDIWTDYEIHSNATFDDVENDLDSFYYQIRNRSSGGSFNMTYLKDDTDGYDINVLSGYPGWTPINASFNYENDTNEFKWLDTTFSFLPSSEYTINVSGVWRDDTPVIDWTNPNLQTFNFSGGFYRINITKFYDTIVIHYSSIADDLYELMFRKTFQDVIIMDWKGLSEIWQWKQMLMSLSSPIWSSEAKKNFFFVEFHLWNINDLVYVVRGAHAKLDIVFYRVWNQIVLEGITYSMSYDVPNYMIFSIGTLFAYWGIGIEIIFDILQNTYVGYKVEIGYFSWEYIYLVPTLVLPNFLMITILESVYTDTLFYVQIRLSDFMGYAVSGAMITGTWNGTAILQDNITVNTDGTFNITLEAILIAPDDPSINLSLTAIKKGYAPGTLNTEISVDPEAVSKNSTSPPPSPSDGDSDSDGKEESSIPVSTLIVLGSIVALAVISVVILTIRKRATK
ncbi:MAG: hypothetical protein EU532_02725 [Promethearchaeota archaeon]|nr:MAG: hypothetical protein EU532_02725 [Candidatus Lokiarchaeota archaeon]